MSWPSDRRHYDGGKLHLAWGDTKPQQDRIVEVFGAGAKITIEGDPRTVSDIGRLICEAVNRVGMPESEAETLGKDWSGLEKTA